MRRGVCAGAILLMATATPVMAGYSAIAAGVNGVGWATGYPGMEPAREAAVAMCRRLGGSCSQSTAEDDSWYFASGRCNGVPYTAASPQSVERAVQIVWTKGAADGNFGCVITKSF